MDHIAILIVSTNPSYQPHPYYTLITTSIIIDPYHPHHVNRSKHPFTSYPRITPTPQPFSVSSSTSSSTAMDLLCCDPAKSIVQLTGDAKLDLVLRLLQLLYAISRDEIIDNNLLR